MKRLLFLKGLTWLILLNLIVKPLWIFAIDRQVQNVVGHEEYGIYFSLLNLSIVFSFIADAGISNMINRQIASGQQIDINKLFWFKCTLSVVYIITLLSVAWLTGVARWEIVALVIALQVVTSFLILFRGIITANQQFTADATVSVLDKALMIIICGPLLYVLTGFDFTVEAFLLIQVACLVVSVIFSARFIWNKKIRPAAVNWSAKKVISLAAPFAIIILLMSALLRLDGFLLERIHINGAYEAGIYASAFRLLDAGNMAGFLVASFLVPFASRNSLDYKLIKKTVTQLKLFLIPVGIAAAILIILFSEWIINLLYTDTANYQVVILKLLITILPALYITHIYGSVLTAKALFRSFITILCFSTFLNISINVVFINKYGAVACCIAAIISQYICAICCWYKGSKTINMKS
jgi:O-antigen/teichoic acid export membrane protein